MGSASGDHLMVPSPRHSWQGRVLAPLHSEQGGADRACSAERGWGREARHAWKGSMKHGILPNGMLLSHWLASTRHCCFFHSTYSVSLIHHTHSSNHHNPFFHSSCSISSMHHAALFRSPHSLPHIVHTHSLSLGHDSCCLQAE